MPRRAARDSRAAVFAAAAREFAARGYDGAGIDRIAARARLNKAMLYYHFGSKRALYLAIARDMFAAVGARVAAIAAGDGGAERKLADWIAALVEEAAARPWFPPIMMRELASGAPHFDVPTVAAMQAVFTGVRAIITQGQREGVFRDVDPLLAHLTILPPVLVYFARQRALAGRRLRGPLAEPVPLETFVCHMQAAALGMLRSTT